MFLGPTGYIAQICEVHLSMKTVQQNGRFTLFSSKFHSNIYSILYVHYSHPPHNWVLWRGGQTNEFVLIFHRFKDKGLIIVVIQ